MKQRLQIIQLNEIARIRVKCVKCNSTTSFPLAMHERIPNYVCPTCPTPVPTRAPVLSEISLITRSLETLATAQDAKFQMSFEVEEQSH